MPAISFDDLVELEKKQLKKKEIETNNTLLFLADETILSEIVKNELSKLDELFIRPIVGCCLEIRCLIAEQGLLRLFFILMKCCNRSGPSTILLSQVLNILQLFTVQHNLIIKLIDKSEYIKDFIMLLLKYYQNNGCELFQQICFLLQAIGNDQKARLILRSNKSFTEAIEYIYKRLFNKISTEDEKYRQLIRSTPKRSTRSIKHQTISLNQSSILHSTSKMKRPTLTIQNENILKQNLYCIEQFMKVFYRD